MTMNKNTQQAKRPGGRPCGFHGWREIDIKPAPAPVPEIWWHDKPLEGEYWDSVPPAIIASKKAAEKDAGPPAVGSLSNQGYGSMMRSLHSNGTSGAIRTEYSQRVASMKLGDSQVSVGGMLYMERDAAGNRFEYFVPDPTPILVGSDAKNAPTFDELVKPRIEERRARDAKNAAAKITKPKPRKHRVA
jgi:hypothetical protein